MGPGHRVLWLHLAQQLQGRGHSGENWKRLKEHPSPYS